MRLFRYIDEMQTIFKYYRLALAVNNPQALLAYFSFICGCLIHLGFIFFMGHSLFEYIAFFCYQAFVLRYFYIYFKDLYLEEHYP